MPHIWLQLPSLCATALFLEHEYWSPLYLTDTVLFFLVLHLVFLCLVSVWLCIIFLVFFCFFSFQSLNFLSFFFWFWPLFLSFFLLSVCLCPPLPHGCLCVLWISVPVVCSVHPPASHSAPSFLRQYAGHLGRTALRREPGGGLERERAFLSLHRTGSLGIISHTHTENTHKPVSTQTSRNQVFESVEKLWQFTFSFHDAKQDSVTSILWPTTIVALFCSFHGHNTLLQNAFKIFSTVKVLSFWQSP